MDFNLPDSPCLLVPMGVLHYPVQDGHLSQIELLNVPGVKDSMWKYLRTTKEGVPVFVSEHSEQECLQWFDIAPNKGQSGYVVSPKGHPWIW